MTTSTTRKATPAKTGNPVTDRAENAAQAPSAVAKRVTAKSGTVKAPAASTGNPVKSIVEPKPADPQTIETFTLSTGTYQADGKVLPVKPMTAATRDFCTYVEAVYGVSLKDIPDGLLTVLITRKGEMQRLVKVDSPRSKAGKK